jgi:NitT/TauT family transport system permease protein
LAKWRARRYNSPASILRDALFKRDNFRLFMTTIRRPLPLPAPRPAPTFSGARRLLGTLILIGVIAVIWEGGKALAAANDYALTIGGASIPLTVFTDEQLPHLGDIARAFAEPAGRNAPPLYQFLAGQALFTLWEAVRGFAIGGVIGFALALLFTYSTLMQRGCLPFVVASQTVPVLAIAPMIVIWMSRADASEWAVPMIAAFLTFFPVVIYTLRGLTSVSATAVELMQTYAASRAQVLFKLRLPNALPHIFTALKLSATASVVGAIIGELPSGSQDGLGIAVLDFARYYNQSPPRLWATIAVAGLLGIACFGAVALAERLIVRWKPETGE